VPLIVRLAEPSDQAASSRVWDESARAAFTPLLPEGHPFPDVDPERWHELRADPAVTMLLAEEDGELLGFTACGESRDPDGGESVGEVRTLFVAAGGWRRGVGSELMAAALDDLRARGYSEATVWSFADNERANRFYESRGFSPDGTERTEEVWANIREIRYRRDL
jgi:GNAT superfamily N-acetyltransferase